CWLLRGSGTKTGDGCPRTCSRLPCRRGPASCRSPSASRSTGRRWCRKPRSRRLFDRAGLALALALGDVQPALHRRPREERIEHALHLPELDEANDLTRAIEAHEVAHTREDRDVGDAVRVAQHPAPAME